MRGHHIRTRFWHCIFAHHCMDLQCLMCPLPPPLPLPLPHRLSSAPGCAASFWTAGGTAAPWCATPAPAAAASWQGPRPVPAASSSCHTLRVMWWCHLVAKPVASCSAAAHTPATRGATPGPAPLCAASRVRRAASAARPLARCSARRRFAATAAAPTCAAAGGTPAAAAAATASTARPATRPATGGSSAATTGEGAGLCVPCMLVQVYEAMSASGLSLLHLPPSRLAALWPCRCPAPCHSGDCAPCPLSARISCACGKTQYRRVLFVVG